MNESWKLPLSVLVVIHTPDMQVLLLRRAGGTGEKEVGAPTEFWQSVTGSKDYLHETWKAVAVREVLQETGIDARDPGCQLTDWQLENIYPIYPQWLHRYEPGVVCNTERVFGLMVPSDTHIVLNPQEHTAFIWHPWQVAAQHCFAASNAEAILWLPRFLRP